VAFACKQAGNNAHTSAQIHSGVNPMQRQVSSIGTAAVGSHQRQQMYSHREKGHSCLDSVTPRASTWQKHRENERLAQNKAHTMYRSHHKPMKKQSQVEHSTGAPRWWQNSTKGGDMAQLKSSSAYTEPYVEFTGEGVGDTD
jgi:hypothetical protein